MQVFAHHLPVDLTLWFSIVKLISNNLFETIDYSTANCSLLHSRQWNFLLLVYNIKQVLGNESRVFDLKINLRIIDSNFFESCTGSLSIASSSPSLFSWFKILYIFALNSDVLTLNNLVCFQLYYAP